MHSNACFALVLLCLAAVQAVPAGKIEKKSVSDELTLGTSDLKLEEAGDAKDRSKKSTFCVQSGASSAQTLNLIPQAPLATQVQTYNLQPALQPVQTLSVVQAPQLAQQAIYVPQQVAPAVQTLQIIQSPQQPCPETKHNIIHERTEVVRKPAPAPARIMATQRPCVEKHEQPREQLRELPRERPCFAPQPERMEIMMRVEPEPQEEIMHVMPIAPPCSEQQVVVVPTKPVMMVSEPQRLTKMVQMPSCPHRSNQAGVSQCSCRNQGYAAARAAGMRAVPMHFARNPQHFY